MALLEEDIPASIVNAMLRYTRCVRALMQRYWRWFALFAVVGVTLRLLFVWKFPLVEGDSLIYGDIAKNWLVRGVYGVSDGEVVRATLIRLPGYPAFLAGCFALFGVEHYRAVMLAQTAMDLGTACVVGA